jgi:hypothetical protein
MPVRDWFKKQQAEDAAEDAALQRRAQRDARKLRREAVQAKKAGESKNLIEVLLSTRGDELDLPATVTEDILDGLYPETEGSLIRTLDDLDQPPARRQRKPASANSKARLKLKHRTKLRLKYSPWEPSRGKYLEVDKGSDTDPFTPLHHRLVHSKAFRSLSGPALQVLIQLMHQFDGGNNGQLTPTLARLRKLFSWGKSPDTLANAIKELVEKKLVRQKSKPVGATPAKYELTWLRNRPRKEKK